MPSAPRTARNPAPSPPLSPPLTLAERHAAGLAARQQMPRRRQALLRHPVPLAESLALLRASEAGRLPALLLIKHQRMAASAFGYFRGAVPVMAADLARQPHSGLLTQLCGDAHVSNLGAFATPDGRLTFDLNDFDETLRGPFEWDIKRLATSLLLAGRGAGIRRPQRQAAVLAMARRYRQQMHQLARLPVLELARFQIHRLLHTPPMPAILAQAERSTPQRLLKSLTVAVKGHGRRFRSELPLLRRVEGTEAAAVWRALAGYTATLQPERRHFVAQYRAVDVAFKVVGTGSIGLRDYVLYLEGTHSPKSDPLFLQVKEEPASAYARYLQPDALATHNGQRVRDGQRAMQLTSDPFLGYTHIDGRDYLVRQLNDHKASLDLTTLKPASLLAYAELCGELLARGHARSGDPVAIAAYLGQSDRMDRALLRFATLYADRTEQYWQHLKNAQDATHAKGTAQPKS